MENFDKQRNNILNLVKKEREFISRLYSAHHNFTIEQIVYYQDKLYWGGGFYTWEESDPYLNSYTTPKIGLCFNSNIKWNRLLVKLAKFEIISFQGTGFDPYELPLMRDKELQERFKKCFYIDLPSDAPDEITEEIIEHHLSELYETTKSNRDFKINNSRSLKKYFKQKYEIDLLQSNLYYSINSLLKKFNIDFLKNILEMKDINLDIKIDMYLRHDFFRRSAFWYFGTKIAESVIKDNKQKIRYYVKAEGNISIKFDSEGPIFRNEKAVDEAWNRDFDDQKLNGCKCNSRNWFVIYKQIDRERTYIDVQYEYDKAIESMKIAILQDMLRLGIEV